MKMPMSAARPINVCTEARGELEIEAGAEDEAEPSHEMRRTMRMQDPKLPRADEVAEHEMAHLPSRSWCKFCTHGRGVEAAHKRIVREPGLPEVHFDYVFPRSDDQAGLALLVMRERGTNMLYATAVARKGATGEYAERRILRFLKEIGLEGADLILKTDQEAAVKTVAEGVARKRPRARTILEESPVKSHGSN